MIESALLAEYGLSGAIMAVMIGLLVFVMKNHRATVERLVKSHEAAIANLSSSIDQMSDRFTNFLLQNWNRGKE